MKTLEHKGCTCCRKCQKRILELEAALKAAAPAITKMKEVEKWVDDLLGGSSAR